MKNYKKLASELSHYLPTETVNFLFETSDLLTEEQKNQLKEIGLTIGSGLGKICTGNAQVQNMEKIYNLEFITRLELSKPLYSEDCIVKD